MEEINIEKLNNLYRDKMTKILFKEIIGDYLTNTKVKDYNVGKFRDYLKQQINQKFFGKEFIVDSFRYDILNEIRKQEVDIEFSNMYFAFSFEIEQKEKFLIEFNKDYDLQEIKKEQDKNIEQFKNINKNYKKFNEDLLRLRAFWEDYQDFVN